MDDNPDRGLAPELDSTLDPHVDLDELRDGGPTRTPGMRTTTGGTAGPASTAGLRAGNPGAGPTTTGDATTGGMDGSAATTTSDASTTDRSGPERDGADGT
jgi:hypothetical protein